MKTNFDVCHAWAHNAYMNFDSSNMSHYDGILRSYNTCIGQRIEVNNNIIYLVDNNRYTNTTDKHQRDMIEAIPQNDDNVRVFYSPYAQYDRRCFVKANAKGDLLNEELEMFGLLYLAEDMVNCIHVVECCCLDHGFTCRGYSNMNELFNITQASSVKKLLKMKLSEFEFKARKALHIVGHTKDDLYYKKMRKLLRMESEARPIEEIVDEINGNGTWQKYMDNTFSLRIRAKNRALSEYVGFKLSEGYIREKHTMFGYCKPVVRGSIKESDCKKHKKAGDYFKWLIELKRENWQKALEEKELVEKRSKAIESKRKIELCIGMNRFYTNPRWDYMITDTYSKFDYNGTIIDFHKYNGKAYEYHNLTDEQYADFLAADNKKEWIKNMKQYTLELLLQDERNYLERERAITEEKRLRDLEYLHYQTATEEKEQYINEMKKKGGEGYRELYHQGLIRNLPYNISDVFTSGNVLLRLNKIRNIVETSKGIKLTIEECKRLWTIFKRWHDKTAECEKGMEVKSISFTYNVHSFKDDVLTVGCHQIAFSEMEYVARQIGLIK